MKSRTMLIALSLALGPVPALAQAAGSLTVAFGAEGTTLDPTKYSAGVDHYFVAGSSGCKRYCMAVAYRNQVARAPGGSGCGYPGRTIITLPDGRMGPKP